MTLAAASVPPLPIACIMSRKGIIPHYRVLNVSACRETPYILFALAIFFGFVGFYIPFCYIQAYSIDKWSMKKQLALYLLTMINAGAVYGHIVSSYHNEMMPLVLKAGNHPSTECPSHLCGNF